MGEDEGVRKQCKMKLEKRGGIKRGEEGRVHVSSMSEGQVGVGESVGTATHGEGHNTPEQEEEEDQKLPYYCDTFSPER